MTSTNNVVLLTTGLSGSSVITGLIIRAGYWQGDKTIVKANAAGHYDTFENEELVRLNDQLLSDIGIQLTERTWYDQDIYYQIAAKAYEIDLEPYDVFIKKCSEQGRWIWKDPRLWVTFGFWLRLLDRANIHAVILQRDSLSLWVSMLNKRQIVNYFELKKAEKTSSTRLIQQLTYAGISSVEVNYDKLIKHPDVMLRSLNNHLGTCLNLSDLKSVYSGDIGKRTYTIRNLIKATLIYFKNIRHRVKLLK